MARVVDEDDFGIAVAISNCMFQAEIRRDGLEETLETMDHEVDSLVDTRDTLSRITYVLQNAIAVAEAMERGELDKESAVSEIAFSFIYVFSLQCGTDDTLGLRGIVAMFDGSTEVTFRPCATTKDFESAVIMMRECATAEIGGTVTDWSAGHTIH